MSSVPETGNASKRPSYFPLSPEQIAAVEERAAMCPCCRAATPLPELIRKIEVVIRIDHGAPPCARCGGALEFGTSPFIFFEGTDLSMCPDCVRREWPGGELLTHILEFGNYGVNPDRHAALKERMKLWGLGEPGDAGGAA